VLPAFAVARRFLISPPSHPLALCDVGPRVRYYCSNQCRSAGVRWPGLLVPLYLGPKKREKSQKAPHQFLESSLVSCSLLSEFCVCTRHSYRGDFWSYLLFVLSGNHFLGRRWSGLSRSMHSNPELRKALCGILGTCARCQAAQPQRLCERCGGGGGGSTDTHTNLAPHGKRVTHHVVAY